jgi:hypothetical protein
MFGVSAADSRSTDGRRPCEGEAMSDAVAIPMPRGLCAYVDPEDADLAEIAWRPSRIGSKGWYARRKKKPGLPQYLHKAVAERMGLTGRYVDHRDRNGLNCRRGNLRAANASQNQGNAGLARSNTTGFKGVDRCGDRWRARIKRNGKTASIGGLYVTAEEAARAYDKAAREHFGEFAWLNFPGEATHD